eukprot:CFRG8189T1
MTSRKQVKIISPVDGSVYATRDYHTDTEICEAVDLASKAFKSWKHTPVRERVTLVERFVKHLQSNKDELALELTWQMGRPVSQAGGEINGVAERALYMALHAEEGLADVSVAEKDGFTRFIRKDPLGVVFVCGAWNYPYLIAVNAVVPALLAGNTVILKQSSSTLLCAERFAEAFDAAGLPKGCFQFLHMTHSATADLIKNPKVAFVNFTGSVEGGRDIQKASSEKFMGVGLELGGKDPAYVRADCDLDYTVEQLVDGSFFNSGQCCCAIERIYVDASIYDTFVDKFVSLVKSFRLGDPTDANTNLGPMVRTSAADWVRKQVKEAIGAGANALVDETHFPKSKDGTPYMGPVVLVDVDHTMSVMKDESFGPVIGIMKVSSDEEAIKLMNDSDFGLTAGVWSKDLDAAAHIGNEVQTGTFFVNKCDYLDPALAWTGVKDSGRGVSLSAFGFDQLTQLKSFNMKMI